MQVTKRIEFIDAMRGFAMLLVVFSHIAYFGYPASFHSVLPADVSTMEGRMLSFNDLFVIFRMPLFFFISGFILYKKDYPWDRHNSWSFFLKKAKVQLIPTVFFLLVYTYIMDGSFLEALFHPAKWGYWFTISLFEYFVIYILYRMLCNLIHKRDGADVLLLVMALLLHFLSTYTGLRFLHMLDTPVCDLLGLTQLGYFLFFAIGTLIKKHYDKVQSLLDNGSAMALVILLFFGLSIYVLHQGTFSNKVYGHALRLLIGFLGCVLVFSFFRRYESSFANDTKIGRMLQYIGRRTLDVYLLHYFFLPRNLHDIGIFFYDNPNPTLELVVSMSLALVVVAVSLLLSNIIRVSPIMAHWLFGAKK